MPLQPTFFDPPTLGERARRAWSEYAQRDKVYANMFGDTWDTLDSDRQACWLAAVAAALSTQPSS